MIRNHASGLTAKKKIRQVTGNQGKLVYAFIRGVEGEPPGLTSGKGCGGRPVGFTIRQSPTKAGDQCELEGA